MLNSGSFVVWHWCGHLNQATDIETIHGRERKKTVAHIAVNTVGEVVGFVEKKIEVKVIASIAGKDKTLVSKFASELLEPQKDHQHRIR